MKKGSLAALLSGCLFTGALAESTNTTINAGRIIVTATRQPDSIRTIAGNPSVITAQDLADGHYTSVPDALQKEAGIFFRSYSDNPSQASADMRGFGDNSQGRVLVLVDGRRLNEADMAALNWSSVPLSAIDRIEVLHGPATTLYGDNAVGGVINIITSKGTDEPVVTLSASGGSHEQLEQNASVSGRTGDVGYTLAVDHQAADGYRERSRYENSSLYSGFDLGLNEYFSANATFSVINRDYQLPGALNTAQMQADRRQSDEDSDVSDRQYNLRTGILFIPDEINAFALDVGYRRADQRADLNREFGSWGTYYDALKQTVTLEPRYTLTLPVGDAMNETTVGMDFRYETIDVDRYASDKHLKQSAAAKIQQRTLDFYLNNRLFLLDDKLILNAGVRSGQSRISARDHVGGLLWYDQSERRHETAYSVGATLLPIEPLKLFIKYDDFYRFPFTDEQALYFGSAWVDSFTALKPEHGNNIEVGGALTLDETSELTATFYRMEMTDEIRYNPFTYANVNLPDTLHQGIELAAYCKPTDLLRFGLTYNFTEAEFNEGPNRGKRIPWVPLNSLRASVDIMPMEGLTLTAGATYTGKMYAINDNGNNGAPQDDYLLTDLMIAYDSTFKEINWNVFAGVDNLFAKKYDLWQVSNATGMGINHYPAPERTFKAGLGIQF